MDINIDDWLKINDTETTFLTQKYVRSLGWSEEFEAIDHLRAQAHSIASNDGSTTTIYINAFSEDMSDLTSYWRSNLRGARPISQICLETIDKAGNLMNNIRIDYDLNECKLWEYDHVINGNSGFYACGGRDDAILIAYLFWCAQKYPEKDPFAGYDKKSNQSGSGYSHWLALP